MPLHALQEIAEEYHSINEGKGARIAGLPQSANPYPNGSWPNIYWDEGWRISDGSYSA
jgi:hypothetical protein